MNFYIEISSILQREPGWPIQLLIQKNMKMTAINNLDKSMRSFMVFNIKLSQQIYQSD